MKKLLTFILFVIAIFGAYYAGKAGGIGNLISRIVDGSDSNELQVKMKDNQTITLTYGITKEDLKQEISNYYTTNGTIEYEGLDINVGTHSVNLSFQKNDKSVKKNILVIIEPNSNAISFNFKSWEVTSSKLVLYYEIVNEVGKDIKGLTGLDMYCYKYNTKEEVAGAYFGTVDFKKVVSNHESITWSFTFSSSNLFQYSFFKNQSTISLMTSCYYNVTYA